MIKIFRHIKTLHEKVKQIDIDDIDDTLLNNNPYSLCFAWLLEVVGFGLIITIPINLLIGWMGWFNINLIFGIGIARWLCLNSIMNIFKSARGKT